MTPVSVMPTLERQLGELRAMATLELDRVFGRETRTDEQREQDVAAACEEGIARQLSRPPRKLSYRRTR